MTAFVCDVLIVAEGDRSASKGLEFNFFLQAQNVFECLELIRQDLEQSEYHGYRVIDVNIQEDRTRSGGISTDEKKITSRHGPKEWVTYERKSILVLLEELMSNRRSPSDEIKQA